MQQALHHSDEYSYRLVKQLLLERNGLDIVRLQKTLSDSLALGGDWADLYLQYSKQEQWSIEDGIVKHGGFHSGQGFGLRLVSEGEVAFAYADDLSLAALDRAQGFVKELFNGRRRNRWIPIATVKRELYSGDDPLASLTETDKIAILKEAHRLAFSLDTRVVQVRAGLSGSWEAILLLDSEGTLAWDIRPLVHFSVTVWLQDSKTGRRESGHAGGGTRAGYDFVLQEGRLSQYVQEAVRLAELNLRAIAIPVGMMPVVLGAGWPGVLIHEAVGHGLEADFNRQGLSVYSDKMGKVIAAPGVSIVDRGNIPERRGSLQVDDEGTATQETVLVENGVLVGYMYDRLNAQLMKTKSTGNGRRESYASLPIPRMTNTYLLGGDCSSQDILSSVERGVYAVNFLGGQVDITSGDFVFTSSEAYLIEHGKLTTPIKGVTLIGQGSEVLKRISMIGNDLQLDPGNGVCGKAGQSVPVGVGMPTVKIDQLQVGGSELVSH